MPDILTDEEIDALLEVVNESSKGDFLNSLYKKQRRILKKLEDPKINDKEKLNEVASLQMATLNDIHFNLSLITEAIKDFQISGSVEDPEIKIYQSSHNLLDIFRDLKDINDIIENIMKMSFKMETILESNESEKTKEKK